MAGKYPETPREKAARIARENEEKRRKKRQKFEVGSLSKTARPDLFDRRPSSKGKESPLSDAGSTIMGAVERVSKDAAAAKKRREAEAAEKKRLALASGKGKKAPEWEDPDKKASAWINPDKKKGKTTKAKDETSDDYTFIDDFGDTDYSGSDWDWDAPFKHGGRIKKAKKAKAKSRKPRSRPAIRGRRKELKGS